MVTVTVTWLKVETQLFFVTGLFWSKYQPTSKMYIDKCFNCVFVCVCVCLSSSVSGQSYSAARAGGRGRENKTLLPSCFSESKKCIWSFPSLYLVTSLTHWAFLYQLIITVSAWRVGLLLIVVQDYKSSVPVSWLFPSPSENNLCLAIVQRVCPRGFGLSSWQRWLQPACCVVLLLFLPCWHETLPPPPPPHTFTHSLCVAHETRLGCNVARLVSPLPFSTRPSRLLVPFTSAKNSRNKSLCSKSLLPSLPPLNPSSRRIKRNNTHDTKDVLFSAEPEVLS